MQKLISELIRLYLPPGATQAAALAQHVLGQKSTAFDLTDDIGRARAIVIPFNKQAGFEEVHWSRLCATANALQAELGFPAPAVSISGSRGFRLWLSLETPLPVAQAQEFVLLLRKAYFPDLAADIDAISGPVELPPFEHQGTGKWAAFIHPGLGASFTEDAGLEMAPPLAGQVAFLEGLQSITAKQFAHGLEVLRQSHSTLPSVVTPVSERGADFEGLLLKDATLEDIISFLHSKDIEPTFRHLVPKSRQ
ncbi:MAG TPA: hypothetical protein VFT37_06185 [Telluria sp.]|nr:hypothetical protein [Telluria sp.]